MDQNITVPLDLLNLVLATLLPILTALVTARFANSAWKSITLLALTVLSTALQEVFNQGGTFDVSQFLYTTVFQFLMSVGLHFGLLKPAKVTGDEGLVSRSVPVGVGGPKLDHMGPVQD